MQSRLNHLMILQLNKEKLDSLDFDAIGNQFIQGSEHCLRFFGKFDTCKSIIDICVIVNMYYSNAVLTMHEEFLILLHCIKYNIVVISWL